MRDTSIRLYNKDDGWIETYGTHSLTEAIKMLQRDNPTQTAHSFELMFTSFGVVATSDRIAI